MAFFTGTAGGAVYTLGPGGVIYIDNGTFYTSEPTSVVMSDGATLMVDPKGAVTIQEASTHTPATSYQSWELYSWCLHPHNPGSHIHYSLAFRHGRHQRAILPT